MPVERDLYVDTTPSTTLKFVWSVGTIVTGDRAAGRARRGRRRHRRGRERAARRALDHGRRRRVVARQVDRIEVRLLLREQRRAEAVLLRLLGLADVRDRDGDLRVADARAALEADRGAVAGAVDVVLLVGQRAGEARAGDAARVACAQGGGAGALLFDLPVHGDETGPLGIGSRLALEVDLLEEAQVVEAVVVATQAAVRDDHAGAQAQLAADHVVVGDRVAGDLDGADAQHADRVAHVRGAGLLVDRGGVDAGLDVAELEVELLVESLERVVVLVALRLGVRAAGLGHERRLDQVRVQQRVAFGVRHDDDVLDRQTFLNLEGQDAVGADVDVGDVRGQLAAEADLVVVAVHLQHVLLVGLDVEDLARCRVHQREQRVGRDARVAGKPDRRDDRVLDDAVGDRDAVRALLDDRRRLVGEEPEVRDGAEVLLHDGGVERIADLRLHDGKDAVGWDVRVSGDRDRHDGRRGRGGRRGIRRRHHETEQREHGERGARRAAKPFEQAEDVLRTMGLTRAPWATDGLLMGV